MGFFWGLARRVLAAVAILFSVNAALAQDGIRMLEGSLTLRERIALPSDALAVVEARDARGRLVGEATFATRGEQVPLDFALGIPAEIEATLRAAIVLEGRPRWFAADIPVPSGTEQTAVGEIMLRRFEPMFAPITLRCGDRELRVGYFGATAELETDGRRIALTRAPSASGARYDAPDDPGTWVWSRSNRALVSLDGQEFPECSVVPPDAPKPYVARGNEPGWTLTVEDGRYVLVTDYGAGRIEGLLPEARYIDGDFDFDDPTVGLAFRISPGLCRDDMTGMPYPESVEVRFGDRSLRGCGGDTLELLLGDEWTVMEIDAEAVPEGTVVTMVFDEDGGLGGQAGCNRYATALEIGGEGVSVGPIAATKMLCPDAQMEQESRFFAALASIVRIDFDEAGALLFFDAALPDPVLVARR